MENSNILIDTSIIVDHLRKKNKSKSKFWKLANAFNCAISTITLFELYSGAKNNSQKKDIDIISALMDIIPYDANQAKMASEIFHTLKKDNKLIEYRDIFIASCAIEQNIPLATPNKKHFDRIENLRLLTNE